jgi:hypothetical protein
MIAGLYDNIFIPRCGMHTLLWHMLSLIQTVSLQQVEANTHQGVSYRHKHLRS